MDKFQVARALNDIATLLALDGQSGFKVRAYRRAAVALELTDKNIAELVEAGRLTELEHVGPSIERTIAELWQTGRSSFHARLAAKLPPGSVELCRVPGLTVRRVRALHEALGIENLRELRVACQEGRVRQVAGFGARTERRILQAIELFLTRRTLVLLSESLAIAERISAYLRRSDAIQDVTLAGEARRRVEAVSELELVALTDDPARARAHFAAYPGFVHVEADGRGRLPSGLGVNLSVASRRTFSGTLLIQTGSLEHLQQLSALLVQRSDGGAPELELSKFSANAESEREIYSLLGLQFVPPELRDEGLDLTAARTNALPELITDSDVSGMVHCHTTYSDGVAGIEEMALAAEELGMSYITITDHSQSAFYAGGLSIDRLKKQWDEIDAVQERVGIRLMKGTESDILADGALDFPDDVLERLDVVIASIHGRMQMDVRAMTQRLERAMRLPLFKIWGHPLGRLVLRRRPVACDLERLLDVIAESRAAIEINADPHRLDLEPTGVRAARKRGIKFVISTDAHSTRGLQNLRFGVMMARRGGLRAADVLNTLSADEFAESVQPA